MASCPAPLDLRALDSTGQEPYALVEGAIGRYLEQ